MNCLCFALRSFLIRLPFLLLNRGPSTYQPIALPLGQTSLRESESQYHPAGLNYDCYYGKGQRWTGTAKTHRAGSTRTVVFVDSSHDHRRQGNTSTPIEHTLQSFTSLHASTFKFSPHGCTQDFQTKNTRRRFHVYICYFLTNYRFFT